MAEMFKSLIYTHCPKLLVQYTDQLFTTRTVQMLVKPMRLIEHVFALEEVTRDDCAAIAPFLDDKINLVSRRLNPKDCLENLRAAIMCVWFMKVYAHLTNDEAMIKDCTEPIVIRPTGTKKRIKEDYAVRTEWRCTLKHVKAQMLRDLPTDFTFWNPHSSASLPNQPARKIQRVEAPALEYYDPFLELEPAAESTQPPPPLTPESDSDQPGSPPEASMDPVDYY